MTLDTNILIAFLNGDEGVVRILSGWKREGRALFISAISVAEVLSLPSLTTDEIEKIRVFLAAFILVSFDRELAEAAAVLSRKYRLKLPDAAIAATSLARDVPLVTRDVQYRPLRELVVLEI